MFHCITTLPNVFSIISLFFAFFYPFTFDFLRSNPTENKKMAQQATNAIPAGHDYEIMPDICSEVV